MRTHFQRFLQPTGNTIPLVSILTLSERCVASQETIGANTNRFNVARSSEARVRISGPFVYDEGLPGRRILPVYFCRYVFLE